MSNSSDIWLAFGQTFAMLFLVLALLILVFYLMKKMTAAKGVKGGRELIKVLTIHHLSPKEKLVLLEVMGDTILIGVTSAGITRIAEFNGSPDLSGEPEICSTPFSQLLSRKMGSALKAASGRGIRKEAADEL